MKKSDYRKFIVKTVARNDDFASMREVVGRRYKRLQEENKTLPDLILIDGGIGQLHAAAEALERLGIINQPLASLAKREEILYLLGREDDPVVLDHHSPALHLIQQIRDEAHRFAVTFHRTRRGNRELASELLNISGIGEKTASKLISHFGSLSAMQSLSAEELGQVVNSSQAKRIVEHFEGKRRAS
jgi:excinuclease ABC subunit C